MYKNSPTECFKENPEEFYSRFHEQLLNSQEWPGDYLFKFILREGEVKKDVLKEMFTQKSAVFQEEFLLKRPLLACR